MSALTGLRSANVLVTGGGSFVASHVVPRLLAEGAQVHVTARSREVPWRLKTYESDIQYVPLASHEAEATFALLKDCAPAHIIHLGGLLPRPPKDADLFHTVNVEHTLSLYKAASQLGVRSFLTFGTQFEYEGAPTPWTEELNGSPQSPYGTSKAEATRLLEQESAKRQTTVTVLRPPTIFGEAQNFTMAIPIWIKASIEKGPIALPENPAVADFIYVQDIVTATLLASQRQGPFRVFNVASGVTRSVQETALHIASLLDYKEPLITQYKGPAAQQVAYSIQRAKNELGWEPKTPFETALKETVRWYQEHKDLFPRLVVA